jgi:hypothetical protein
MSNTSEKKTPAAVTPEAQKPKKGRSPAYPAVALDKAIDMARKVYDGQRKQEAHIDSTLRAIGYSSQSGSSLRAIAALKQYGLVQDTGDGDNRRIKLTDAALDILLLPESDPRKFSAIKAAALAPAIHAALWERYGALLPEDGSLMGYLTRDREYHDEAAQDIVSNYRTTFALAKLDKSEDSQPEPERPANTSKPDASTPPPERSQPERKMNLSVQEMPILVGPDMVAKIPFPMSEEDFDLFVGTLQLWKKKLVKRNPPSSAPVKFEDIGDEPPVR